MKKAAVLLCGSGHLDGTEIREAVGALWALSKHGFEVQCFAPDSPQKEVVNTLTGKPVSGESRSMLVESARIARGNVLPLSKLKVSDYSALVIPGGYGAAKNLCTFAAQGSAGTVLPEAEKVIRGFFEAGKPIGALCIAPALVALVLKGKGLELTVGASGEVPQEIEKLGHKHVAKSASQWQVDRRHKVVTTPAYMFDTAPLHEIFEGINGTVASLVELGA